jgi:hypothetical protein
MWRTGLPVRSAILKPHAGQLVLKSVTIWESWLLIVFLVVLNSSLMITVVSAELQWRGIMFLSSGEIYGLEKRVEWRWKRPS